MNYPKLFRCFLVITILAFLQGCAKDDDSSDPANSAPNVPSNPAPADQATNQLVSVDLSWSCSDPDQDPLTYDVYFGTASTPPQVSSGQSNASYDPGTLANSVTYYWRIAAHDDHGQSTQGAIWSFTTSASGITEVLVLSGPFNMGAEYQENALPVHTVNLPAFYIDVYEVTNAQYKAFCDATSRAYPQDPFFFTNYFTSPIYANYPVVNVSWNDARDYAQWAGKRLPSEAEWERAAKGNSDNRQWPWGNTWNDSYANITGSDPWAFTAPVGSFPNGISPAGCHDMAGNVREWCEDDWHSDYIGAPTDGSAWIDNPRGESRVYRGGAWGSNSADTRCAFRLTVDPAGRAYDTGFRCARTP